MSADQLFIHQGREESPALDMTGLVRRDDMDTSKLAAVRTLIHRADGKRRVLLALYNAGDEGMTDFEHFEVNGMVQQSAGKRRLDLQREDPPLVRRACAEDGKGLTRPSTSTNSEAAVWCLTAAGYIAAETVAAGCGYLTGPQT